MPLCLLIINLLTERAQRLKHTVNCHLLYFEALLTITLKTIYMEKI